MSYWEELKRRNVVKVGVAYLALVWLVVQIASVVLPAFESPPWAMQALIFGFVLGFPIVIICAWVYEMTPEGLKRTDDVSSEDRRRMHPGRKLDFAIIGVLSLALVTVVIDQYLIDGWERQETIAVLPFRNLSGDPDQEYFADGMTDALIANLAKIDAIDVISRTSVMRFKNVDLSLPEIAAALGATAIVEASAQRAGERVRINASLFDGTTDRQLWGGTFDEELTNVLSLQSELAREIADGIHSTITPDDEARLRSNQRVDPAAYDAYLRGMAHLHLLTPAEFDLAERYFEQARELDPDSALGHAGLAQTWAARAQLSVVPAQEAAPLARVHAQRAALIDDRLASVQIALETVDYLSWDLDGAEAKIRRAIELEPGNAEARFHLANLRLILGDSSEAIEQIAEAVRLDPLNPLYKMFEGVVLANARQYDASIASHRAALDLAPGFAITWNNLAASLHLAGQYDEALVAEREWLNATRNVEGLAALDAGLEDGSYTEAMQRVADVLERQALTTGASAITAARHYARAGDWEKVIEWLNRAVEDRNPNALMIRSPELEPVRDDPRILALIERMGL